VFKFFFFQETISLLKNQFKKMLGQIEKINAPMAKQCTRHKEYLDWFECQTCERTMCFLCSEPHLESNHDVKNRNELLRNPPADIRLNTAKYAVALQTLKSLNDGAKIMLRLQSVKCPCGKPFDDNDNCAVCCFCVSATCSDKCHRFYCQDTGLCQHQLMLHPQQLQQVNGKYNPPTSPEPMPKASGCRCISKVQIDKSLAGTVLSLVRGPRFIEVSKSIKETLIIERGYQQFGQPVIETLLAMQVLDSNLEHGTNTKRKCLCNCVQCANPMTAIHPYHVCSNNLPSEDRMQQ